MGRYQAYPDYKDSGVEWLGKIPKSWECVRLKNTADLIVEKLEPGLSLKYVGLENIESGSGKYIETEDLIPEGQANSFSQGNVLFGKLRPYLAKSWLAGFSGICSSEFLVLKSKLVNSRFLNYFTLSSEFIKQVDSSTYGSKMPRASWDFIGLLEVPVPLDESEKIANFLDHETAKIDTLIEQQQQLIQLLKEKRQAVISHAVTKGLNPDTPMKDSGVEWLGEVPDGWRIAKLGQLAFMQEGPGLRTWQFTDSGTRVICVTNITADGIDFLKMEKFISHEEYKRSYQHFTVENGDILLSSSGNSWGKVAQYEGCEKVILNTSTIRLKELPHKPLVLDYIKYFLMTEVCREQLSIAMTGSCQPNFGPSHLKEIKTPIPSVEEQMEIVKFIKKQMVKFEKPIQSAESAVQLMQERRTALISAAVTGKIDVRNWQAPQ